MSVVRENLQSITGRGSARTWYLKSPDGTTYGPVQLSVLCEWAAQSRISPGHEVSEDGQNWAAAESFPELKLEWMAELPDGRTYGPFNVLAVPQLFGGGTLPADAKLVNPGTGKTLYVRELVKSQTPQPAPPETSAKQAIADDGKWEERYHEEKRVRLLHETQLQQTIDRLNSEARVSGETLKAAQERVQREVSEYDALKQKNSTAEQQLKQGVEQLQAEARTLRIELENARRELAEQKRGTEGGLRQASMNEDKLRDQVERLKRDLQLAVTNSEAVKRDALEERRNAEALRRQTQLKEQELTRMEDQRRQAEGRAGGSVDKVALDHAVETSRADTLRAREEEARFKARIDKLDKELLDATRDLAEQRKRAQMLEKEIVQKESRIQVQAADFKRKADGLTAELERLKKETESQRSLRAEADKAASEREASLKREALFSRSAMVKAEHELAAVRKQFDLVKEQALQRETELGRDAEKLREQLQKAGDENHRLQGELTRQAEGSHDSEQKVQSVAQELATARARVSELQNVAEALRKELGQRQDSLAKIAAEMEREKAGQRDLKVRFETELGTLRNQVSQLTDQSRQTAEQIKQAREKEDAITRTAEERAAKLQEAIAENGRLKHQLDESCAFSREVQLRYDQEKAAQAQQVKALQEESARLQSEGAERQKRMDGLEKQVAAHAGELSQQAEAFQKKMASLTADLDAAKQRELEARRTADLVEKELSEKMKALSAGKTRESGLEAEEARKQAEFAQRLKVLQDENEWVRQELKQQQERYRQLEASRSGNQDQLAQRLPVLEEKVAAANREKEQFAEQLRAAKSSFAESEDRYTREISILLKKLAVFEKGTAGAETGKLEIQSEAEARNRGLQQKVEELEEALAGARHAQKEADKNLAIQKAERENAEKKAMAAGQELDRIRTELHKVRQQHESLQVIVKNQDKSAQKKESVAADESSLEESLAAIASEKHRLASKTVMAAGLVLVMIAALLAFQFGVKRGRQEIVQRLTVPEPESAQPMLTPVTEPPPTSLAPDAGRPAWPKFHVKGVRVTTDEKQCVLVFEYGVFSQRTVLTPDAEEALGQIAAQVKEKMDEFTLIVEGHCDTTPVSSESAGNNYTLGLARANTVVDLLKGSLGLPGARLMATSRGEEDPPYSNDDEASRRKNRTVVLRLVPRETR